MSNVPLVSVNLATVCIESFTYGVFFVLSISSIWLLKHRHDHINKATKSAVSTIYTSPMFLGAVALLTTISAHWFLTCTRLFQAFVHFDNGTDPLLFYADLRQLTEVVKTGFLMASLVIGDAMVIYRLWTIWNHNLYVIIFPACTLVGLTVCGVGITYQFTQYTIGEDVFISAAGRWITSDCVFTLCTNVYSSVMIAWRVWNSHRSVKSYGGGNLMKVLATFVESAALYTSWTIFFFASYQSHSNLQFTAVDVWPSMSGIAFMLINTRVGLGWAQTASTFSGISSIASGNNPRPEQPYPMRPLAVNITREVNKNDDRDNSIELDKHVTRQGYIDMI
ncbi:hypothetical protein WOLCODRAFT_140118 [Wolfiporia cocos MD-104 SS10]|uniref:Uncharacterized protein n=1 Tax=Wolfiporia cocos (strain MD-104) TaxID=742152 RepID=A0A2H3J111_WOLCO|nr:hypothetical protein WOLCODRAFT_140118 [Wolfiporia cocos MD-104 SS10]